MSDVSMVYFRAAGGVGLAAARDALREAGLEVNEAGDGLLVSWDDGPVLRIVHNTAPDVAAEAAALAETAGEPPVGMCDARFEIAIDDLDEVLDEINTLIETQSTLQHLSRGYVSNSWNDELLLPDDDA